VRITIEAPADAAEAADVRQRLEAFQLGLARKRGELDQAEHEAADLRLSRAMGGKVDTRRLATLASRVEELTREIGEDETITIALQDKLAAWESLSAERRHSETVAAMQEIAERAPAQEAAFERLALELVGIAQTMLADAQAFDGLNFVANSIENAHPALRRPPLRGPWKPPPLPEGYFRVATPTAPFAQWLREWVRGRPGFAGHEQPTKAAAAARVDGPHLARFVSRLVGAGFVERIDRDAPEPTAAAAGN
jgi:hypothetical protein